MRRAQRLAVDMVNHLPRQLRGFLENRARGVLGQIATLRGQRFGRSLVGDRTIASPALLCDRSGPPEPNPLEAYFDAHRQGPGIWKWRHYFDIYHNHLSQFVGREVHVLEIGIFSGGSLPMWRSYFGRESRIYGVDIEEACRAYEADGIRIFVGDQGDPAFWDRFKREVGVLDVVIDDGGHEPHQQVTTFEALMPHLRPGGVYLCEDIHGSDNRFHSYVCGVSRALNGVAWKRLDAAVASTTNSLQRTVHSIHFYPFVTVIERAREGVPELVAPKHGTEWQPFL